MMARLRQQPTMLTPPPALPSPPQPQPPPDQLRQNLLAARNALQGGRTEEGVRTLQEVQLRLVFRPVGPDNVDAGSAGPAASNVGRALDAVSNNNIASAQQYIERAVADLSGGAR